MPRSPGGLTHRYLEASPGCWALYTTMLALEFDAFNADTHRLSVNTYAVQHPGEQSPQTIQSVCTHLVALCLTFEHGQGVEELRPMMGDMSKGRFFEPRWLEPPTVPYPMTINTLIDATTPEAYGARVRLWAKTIWNAWSPHHEQVRRSDHDRLAARRWP